MRRSVSSAIRSSRGIVVQFADLSFCIEDSGGPLYFKLGDNDSNTHIPHDDRQNKLLDVFSREPLTYFSSFVKGFSFAKNNERHRRLKGEILTASNGTKSLTSVTAFNANHFEYGYFSNLGLGVSRTSFLDDLETKELLGDSKSFTVFPDDGNISAKFFNEDSIPLLPIIPISPPNIHPAFMFNDTNSVYKCIDRVYDVLNEFESLGEVKELLKICNRHIHKNSSRENLLSSRSCKTVIVLEGLDATGKSTLAKGLAEKLNGTVVSSIPDCIVHLRPKFDSHPELLRRAFYALANYAFDAITLKSTDSAFVIVDRFWYSTAAYALATNVSVGEVDCLPPVGHEVYIWPTDLMLPDAVLLVTVNDEERRRRLIGRGSVKTAEEIRLEQSSPFRQRLEEAFMRMRGPVTLGVDASGTREILLHDALKLLKSNNLI